MLPGSVPEMLLLIQSEPFALFQNAFVDCYSSAPSLKMDTKNTTTCRVPFDDNMPSFMNFRRVLDLLEFKNQVAQCLWPSDGGRVCEIHSHFLHGT